MNSVPGVGNWPPDSFNLWGMEMTATTRGGGGGVLADLDGWLEAKLFPVLQLRLQLTTMMMMTNRLKSESESSANSHQVVAVGDDDDNGRVMEKNDDDDDKDEMNYNVDNVQQQQQQQLGERNNAEDGWSKEQKTNTVEKVELILCESLISSECFIAGHFPDARRRRDPFLPPTPCAADLGSSRRGGRRRSRPPSPSARRRRRAAPSCPV